MSSRKCLWFTSLAWAMAMVLSAAGRASAANPAADLDQCRNGDIDHPVACAGGAWVNGNAGASNAHWLEGDSIAYRMRFSNLSPGTHYFLTIEWDTTKSGKHALDYITSFDRSANSGGASADPCSGVAGCTLNSKTDFQIPADLNTGLAAKAGTGRWSEVFKMYNGGTVVGIFASYSVSGVYTGDSSTTITIEFTTTKANPVLAWGGHIATREDWGVNLSAIAINGSPYHMRLVDLNGAGGNQDRSLSNTAAIFPASLTVIKNVVSSTGADVTSSQTFSFSGNPSTEVSSPFGLTDDGAQNPETTPASREFLLATFNAQGEDSVTITESLAGLSGFTLDNLACTEASGGLANKVNSTWDKSTLSATINAEEGEIIVCTFTNKVLAATLTVVKKVITDNGGNASPSAFAINVTNGGSVNVSKNPVVGQTPSEGTAVFPLEAGTYVVSETGLTGYTQTGITGACDGSGNVTLAAGDNKTCTITNDDDAATLIIIKHVIRDNGGPLKNAGDFSLTIGGVAAEGGQSVTGTESPGVTKTLTSIGSYTVTEDGVTNGKVFNGTYGVSYSADCTGTIALGQTKTCTVTNDDVKASPGITSAMRWILKDSATLTGFVTGAANPGALTFTLYTNTTCTGNPVDTIPVPNITAGGPHEVTSSVTFTEANAGPFRWKVHYDGDSNNNSADIACGDEKLTISLQ
jgi:Prealbumin-like fold domain